MNDEASRSMDSSQFAGMGYEYALTHLLDGRQVGSLGQVIETLDIARDVLDERYVFGGTVTLESLLEQCHRKAESPAERVEYENQPLVVVVTNPADQTSRAFFYDSNFFQAAGEKYAGIGDPENLAVSPDSTPEVFFDALRQRVLRGDIVLYSPSEDVDASPAAIDLADLAQQITDGQMQAEFYQMRHGLSHAVTDLTSEKPSDPPGRVGQRVFRTEVTTPRYPRPIEAVKYGSPGGSGTPPSSNKVRA